LARAITRHGKQQGLQPLELANFESITGQGLRARRNGESCLLGRREWLAQGPHAAVITQVAPTEAGFSEIWLAEGNLLGRLILRDDIRPQAREVVENCTEGLCAVVLTGDRKATAEHLRTVVD
jgi:Cd2+/Zn2+-exporting ATPase